MEHHLTRDNTIKSGVIVPVSSIQSSTTTRGLISEDSSSGFVYKLVSPVRRVSSIDIARVAIPNTFYNVNDDQVRIDWYLENSPPSFDYSSIVTKPSISIDSGLYNIADLITDINASATSIAADTTVPIMNFTWNEMYTNKVLITAEQNTGVTEPYMDMTLLFNSLMADLGFNTTPVGRLGFVSTSTLGLTFPFTINDTNNTMTVRRSVNANDLDITIPNGEYPTIQTLVSVFNKALNVASETADDTDYVGYAPFDYAELVYSTTHDKVILYITTQGASNSALYASITSGLATLFKFASAPTYTIGVNVSKSIFVADRPVNYTDDEPLQLIKYSEYKKTSSTTYTIPVGQYTTEEIITALNTANGGDFLSLDPVTKKVTTSEPFGFVYSSGLAILLGHNVYNPDTIYFDPSLTIYTYINTPNLYTKFIYINSREISRIRVEDAHGDLETQTTIVESINNPLATDVMNYAHNKTRINLSRKETISFLDFFCTDDNGKVINFNGGVVAMTLHLNTT